jgi:hypothetical protein
MVILPGTFQRKYKDLDSRTVEGNTDNEHLTTHCVKQLLLLLL